MDAVFLNFLYRMRIAFLLGSSTNLYKMSDKKNVVETNRTTFTIDVYESALEFVWKRGISMLCIKYIE